MSKPISPTTAAEIAAMVPSILQARAEREAGEDWSSSDSQRDYVALLRSGAAWRVNANTVVANVISPYAEVWGYAVAEALDTASQDFDLPRGHVRYSGPGHYVLNLDCDCGGACTLPAE
jgi:hypothetical protein